MYNANQPPLSELPSSASLIKSTVWAAGAALLLLLTIVMPAEYGIDPTGLGGVTGLKRMGEIKVSLASRGCRRGAVGTERSNECHLSCTSPCSGEY